MNKVGGSRWDFLGIVHFPICVENGMDPSGLVSESAAFSTPLIWCSLILLLLVCGVRW